MYQTSHGRLVRLLQRFAAKYDFDLATTGIRESDGQIIRDLVPAKAIEPEQQTANDASGDGHESNTSNQENSGAQEE